ncbi:MAG: GIY-YIG nuclease family protein [Patescibacteria group bacterium]|nr:GIY-YIG nuclease family protein [Patescibacteria group bacterium]
MAKRVKEHNDGKSRYTNQHRPYQLICYIALPLKSDAERFEKYLKSGYGRRTLRKMLKDFLEG